MTEVPSLGSNPDNCDSPCEADLQTSPISFIEPKTAASVQRKKGRQKRLSILCQVGFGRLGAIPGIFGFKLKPRQLHAGSRL